MRNHPLSRIVFCLLALTGCSRKPVAVDLKALSSGFVGVSLDGPSRVWWSLGPEKDSFDCPVIPAAVTATLNGRADIVASSPGSVEHYEGGGRCNDPYFLFSLDSIRASAGTLDGEFVVSQGTDYQIRVSVSNLAAERKMIRLTALETVKPGDEIRYEWQPSSDLMRRGEGGISGRDGYDPTFDVRIESHQLIGNLPTAAWPAGADFYFEGHAVAPITSCEGVKTCWFGDIGLGDNFKLP